MENQLPKGYTVGADIECFLQHKETGEIISAEGIIKGTKHEPFIFDDVSEFHATSLDNVMAEFCIPPCTTVDDFIGGIFHSKKYIESLDDKLCTAFIPCNLMDEKYLLTENSQTFGCEPDYNCWSGEVNPRPKSSGNLRTAGFHVHMGYDNPNDDKSMILAKFFDLYVTLPSLLLEPDNDRRKMYGKAGAMRFKGYGLECRTLSSFFASNEENIRFVFNQTVKAINAAENFSIDINAISDKVQRAINKNDKKFVQEIVNIFNIMAA